MNRYIFLFLILCVAGCNAAGKDEVYLFSFFQGNGEDGLHLAYSEDGYHWKALNNNEPFLAPEVGNDKLMRDPCIIKGPDGKFHMVWTVSWNERGIGYANSEDLIHWSEQKYIPVMEHEPEAKNCWAPELFYDAANDQYMIYWSTTIPGRFSETANRAEEDWNHRIYYITTTDFEKFSDTQLLYDPGFNVIDAVIKYIDGQYVMVVKDETKFPEAKKDLHISTSSTLTEGYGPASLAISDNWVEGPTVTRIKDQWVIFFDRYREHEMGAIASGDLQNWTDISNQITFPEGTRHGTVFKINREVFNQLPK